MPLQQDTSRIQVAVIEGAHPFDVPAWHQMFRAFDFIDYYPQPIDNWLADWGGCRNAYDVALFYNMNMDPKGSPLAQNMDAALEEFTAMGHGVCLLHHALIAFPQNPVFAAATGLPDRCLEYHPDQDLCVDVANPDHPISRGMESFMLHDETYIMTDASPDHGNDVLFTTAYAKSMKTLGWTRTLNKSRVFCMQSGHDSRVWETPPFREIIGRGLKWLAHRLD